MKKDLSLGDLKKQKKSREVSLKKSCQIYLKLFF